MANLVQYGSFNFSTVCGGFDPFVGVSDEQVLVGGRFKTAKRITVQGRIIPDAPHCPNSQTVTSKINSLINGLKDDFLSLSAGGLSLSFARCESIDVSQSNFFEGANFTANFLGYPDTLSAFGFNVLDPVDNKQITENRDGTISVVRTISVRGISTNSSPNAIQNARNFINSLNPTTSPPQIFFTIGQLTQIGNIKPRRVIETVNRMEGSVSLDLEFVYRNTAPNNDVVLSYTTDISYDDKNGIYSITLNGNFVGGLETTMETLRSNLNRLNAYSLARARFIELSGFKYLNPLAEQYSIEEDALNTTLNFSYTYVSDPYNVKSSITSNVSYDYIRDINTVSINGTLTARGPQKGKEQLLKTALAGINFYSLANSIFQKSENKIPPLNPNPVNKNIVYNKYKNTINEIQFSVEFSNQNEIIDPDIIKFEYTLNVTPSIKVYTPIQFLKDGKNGIFDLSFFKRGVISIKGSAIGKNKNLSSRVRSLAQGKLRDAASVLKVQKLIVTEDNVTRPIESEGGYNYQVSISENCETEIFNQ